MKEKAFPLKAMSYSTTSEVNNIPALCMPSSKGSGQSVSLTDFFNLFAFS